MVDKTRSAWADLPAEVRAGVKWGAGVAAFVATALTGVGVASGSRAPDLAPRVDAVEARVSELETVARYTACVLKSQADGVDPRPCESHLSPDVLQYLRPAGRL